MDITTIFRKYARPFIDLFRDKIPNQHLKTIYDICNCRTEALGGHLDYCDNCKSFHIFYHSCYNRCCPQCQGTHAKKWLIKQADKLLPLPVSYFHIVFTVPHQVGVLIGQYPRILLNILFDAVNISLKRAIKKKYGGGVLGALCVLHTWNRQLGYHPHIHCLVPGILIDKNTHGNWRFIFTKKKFFAPVWVLSTIFSAVFVRLARKKIPHIKFPQSIFKKNWVVYSKPTFKNTEKVLQYLSLYIYRTGISNSRIISDHHSQITFSYKDSTGHQTHYMTLNAMEFLRRFLQHTLPPKFHKARFFGFFSPSYKKILSSLRMELLKLNLYRFRKSAFDSQKSTSDTSEYLRICPLCNTGILRTIAHVYVRKNFFFINRPPPSTQ